MKRSERAKREKKPVSYKEEVLSEEELDPKSIEEPENQSEEEVKEIKKRKKKEDDSESEEFELHDDVEDEISISSDEEIEDADLDEEYEKKIKPGRKRKGNQKLQDVLPKSEKKTRGRKKKETEVPDKKEIKLPRELKAKTKCNLDPDFNLDRDYFYQNLTEIEEEEIKVYLKDFFKDDKIRDETEIKDFLGKYPNLRKNKANLDFIQKEYFIIEK